MGILRKITDEYFGDMFRKEDMVLSDVLKKCIKNGKREKFISYFEGLDKSKRFIVFDNDTTMIGGEKIATETEAHNELFNSFIKMNFKTRCVSIENLMTRPDEYKNYVECWNKLPAKTKPVFEKIFELFYEFPVYTSTFIALHLTFATGRTINILPCEIKMLNALDIFKPKVFQDDDSLGEKCFAIILPDGYTNLYAPSGFSDKISALSKELAEKFEKNGYVNMRNVPDSIIRGYSNVGVSVFVKKKK